MNFRTTQRMSRWALIVAAVAVSTPSYANFGLPGGDVWLDGSFQGITYGAGGIANLTPRLYVSDLGGTLPPMDQVLGTGLDFAYATPVFGGSTLEVTYTLTNNDFAPWSDLRFFLDLKAQGASGALDVAGVSGFGAAASAGEPDQFRVFDFDAAGDKPLQIIESSNALNGSTATDCLTGCYTDMALQWNLAELAVGATWEVTVQLVDDPALIGGGRYLSATTLDASGTSIAFGAIAPVPEPEISLMLLSGLAMIGWRARRV